MMLNDGHEAITPEARKSLKTCFYICPIGEESSSTRKRTDDIQRWAVDKALEQCGYGKAIRADLLDEPGIITNQILDLLFDVDLVIADLSNHNPNVFYELAIRHITTKPVIQISKSVDRLPFDVSGIRTIFFDESRSIWLTKLQEDIKKQIEKIETPGYLSVHPLSQFIQSRDFAGTRNNVDHELPGVAASIGLLETSITSQVSEVAESIQEIRSILKSQEWIQNRMHKSAIVDKEHLRLPVWKLLRELGFSPNLYEVDTIVGELPIDIDLETEVSRNFLTKISQVLSIERHSERS